MSLTSKTKTRRKLRKRRLGRSQKQVRNKLGTPPFPVDPAQAGPDSAEKPGAQHTAAVTFTPPGGD